jgi:demethylmenaquinone methyltransferase/2-methoxy-6-polyprenyl-1,4-benzoquinol methylase
MLDLGKKKLEHSDLQIELIEGDALNLPIADSAFDVVTIAFGLRNLDGTLAGLQEIHRVLKNKGRCVVLEFSRPRLPVFRGLFHFYFTKVLPRIGNAVSGSRFAYTYLPESVQAFPDQNKLANLMESVGFSGVKYYNLFGGVASLHVGDKRDAD